MPWISKLRATLREYFLDVFRGYPLLLPLAGLTALGQISAATINSYAFSFYILDDIGASGAALGYLTAAYLVAETALKLPFGQLSDRYGRHGFIVGGLLATAIMPAAILLLPVSLFAHSVAALYFVLVPLRMLGGAGAAAAWPPVYAVVPDHVEEEHRGAAMAVINSAYAAGIAVGPALAAAFASLYVTRDWEQYGA